LQYTHQSFGVTMTDTSCGATVRSPAPGTSEFAASTPGDKPESPSSPASQSLVSQWGGTSDPNHPYQLLNARKWLITIIVANGAACVASTSSIYASADSAIQSLFQVTHDISVLGLSLFLLGLGLGPLLLSPLSEFYGRRIVLLVSYTLFVILQTPTPLASNTAMVIVPRFFAGLAGSAFLTVAGGTVSDMFSTEHLAAPMSVYTASPFLGTIIGPVIGGFLCENVGWEWAFWVMLIWYIQFHPLMLSHGFSFLSVFH